MRVPKVPPWSSPNMQNMDSWHLFPQLPNIQWHYSSAGCFPRPLAPHLNSWVDWSNVSKVLSSRNNSNTKVTTLGIEPRTFQLSGWCPSPGCPTSHKHTHACARTHTHIRTHAPTHKRTHAHTHTYTHAHTITQTTKVGWLIQYVTHLIAMVCGNHPVNMWIGLASPNSFHSHPAV